MAADGEPGFFPPVIFQKHNELDGVFLADHKIRNQIGRPYFCDLYPDEFSTQPDLGYGNRRIKGIVVSAAQSRKVRKGRND